ncbi:UNKNOWN [Stylonychia lemnae]|uniref:Uncharacterized protein n=1 Tax=Stylonychia lemnae TaxID=5949 RepID=A0A078ABH9_STYLE|nr:UNKNOWN [Stylonychia lemnae]|eukprot:CDW78932.1 UNKNOWN [Stylonychia lemnae]
MEIDNKVLRIKLEDFATFLEKELNNKYAQGLEGLRDRFQTLMVIFKDIMTYTQEIYVQAIVESIMFVLNMIINEYSTKVLDNVFVQEFLSHIQERVEFIYSQFHLLEQMDLKDKKSSSKLKFCLRRLNILELINSLCQKIAVLILKIPPSIIEIQKRYDLSMPLLKFISDAFFKLRDPVNKYIERLSDMRLLKNMMIRKHTKESIANFLSVLCPRDQENSNQGSSGGASTKTQKTKREQIFEELNTMIGFTKRLEFQIRKCLDTPIKLFKIIRSSQTKQHPYGKDLLSDDLKQDDLNKIYKYTQNLTGNPFTLVDFHLADANLNELIHSIQLLDQQKLLQKELLMQPLIREGFEEIQPFDMNEFKDYVEKVKKINNKIRMIYEFQAYDLDPNNSLRSKDIQDLIDSLKFQHDFIYEIEHLYKLYLQIKARVEKFCNKEFIQINSDYNCIEVFIEEFQK